jgi:hypothetical protein
MLLLGQNSDHWQEMQGANEQHLMMPALLRLDTSYDN